MMMVKIVYSPSRARSLVVRTFVIILLAAAPILVSTNPAAGSDSLGAGKTKSDEYFKNTPKAEISKFVGKLKQINIGDSWTKIETLLGNPDRETVLMRKERPEVVSVVRKYELRIVDNDNRNPRFDRTVALYFSKDGKTLESLSSNLDEYKRREGFPDQPR